MKRIYLLITLLLTFSYLLIISCEKDSPTTPEIVNNEERILVQNNEDSLNLRTDYFNDEMIIEPLDSSFKKISKTSDIKLVLKATIIPPKTPKNLYGESIYLHANHVTLSGNYAYISYHLPEKRYCGAVDIVDVSNIKKVKIMSTAIILDTDITLAVRQNNQLLLGEATDLESKRNSKITSPAVIEAVELQAGLLTQNSKRLDLQSYNANDIYVEGNDILVTTGTTDGTLSIVDSDLNLVKKIDITGAKAVEISGNNIIIMEGTGSKLHYYDKNSYSFIKQIELGFPNNSESKAETDIWGQKLFFSAWQSGMKVFDLQTETIIHSIPVLNNAPCNAVSVDEGLAFMANGSEGVYVVKTENDGFEVLGSIELGASSNFVATKGNLLFVATGSNGFKIIEIERN